MKKTLLLAAAVFALCSVSCLKEEVLPQQGKTLVFTATIDTALTRTTLDADPQSATAGKVSWELNDVITVQDKSDNTAVYKVSSITEDGKAIFEYKSGSALGAGPYSATYGGTSLTKQTYSEIPGRIPMTAYSQTRTLSFGVTCGMLKMTLTKSGESIKRIAVTGIPTDGEETTYVLNCDESQSLSTARDFYIILPEGTYNRYAFYDSDGKICTKSAKDGKGTVIKRNKIQPITFSSSLAFDHRYEYVDLGLSVKWATTNVEALYPEQQGAAFAWGETASKETYEWDTYSFTRYVYVSQSKYNSNDKKTVLEAADDAAYVNWGRFWRMPTYDEWKELIDNCTWTWTSLNGVEGYKVTSNKEGYTDKSIFLPEANYWTSELSCIEDSPELVIYADALVITSDESGPSAELVADDYCYERYLGFVVRPVFEWPLNLTFAESANCYIVSGPETYKFKAVKGNSDNSVGDVKGVKVLWESFGTDTAPSVGDLISSVSYSNGTITFRSTDKKGNAVIAAYSDADCTEGNILWSWHIWLTDEPVEQKYININDYVCGSVMDRNLGATSATPGDVKSLGLLYQWGRKDPFPGASSITGSAKAAATISWPDAVPCSIGGNIDYTVSHPTTYVQMNTINFDWYYNSSSTSTTTDDTRWSAYKTIYDPCPAGWSVPLGGQHGLWATAAQWYSTAIPNSSSAWDDKNKGIVLSNVKSITTDGDGIIWYPAAYFQDTGTGSSVAGNAGYYWSCSPDDYLVSSFIFDSENIYTVYPTIRAGRQSVRCAR